MQGRRSRWCKWILGAWKEKQGRQYHLALERYGMNVLFKSLQSVSKVYTGLVLICVA